ncbi:uncharacterized protein UHOD_11411 [Ustilago sp. UG-2017b]|nr:uncharacterized protein UHOD_11411 [Ustilago sp. UG-2017b]
MRTELKEHADVGIAGVQSPWRPWTRRTRPIRKEVQAPPQGGPSSRSMQTVVIGLSTQVAWRLLVHRGGAQVPRVGSQKKTTIAGLGMVEQEARGLAGTGSRHGRSATSMETMDMEDRAVCMEVQAPPQGGPSSRSIQMVTT